MKKAAEMNQLRTNRMLTMRLRTVLKWVLYLLAAVLFCLFENTWYVYGSTPENGGAAVPYLLPMLAAVCGALEGMRGGAYFGIFCGVLSDASGGSRVWLLPVFYALLGFLSGLCAKDAFKRRFSVCFLSMCAGALLCAAFRLCTGWIVSGFSDPLAGIGGVAWSLLLSGILGFLFCLPIMLISVVDEDTTRHVAAKRTRVSGGRLYKR